MTLPRKKTERWKQILRWLEHDYPAPFPVKLVFGVPDDGIAESFELEGDKNRVIYIMLDDRRSWRDGIHDLLHEYGHALTWPISKRQFEHAGKEHPASFWGAYGEVYSDFFDEDGSDKSQEY